MELSTIIPARHFNKPSTEFDANPLKISESEITYLNSVLVFSFVFRALVTDSFSET